jgi:hypothetical protein
MSEDGTSNVVIGLYGSDPANHAGPRPVAPAGSTPQGSR